MNPFRETIVSDPWRGTGTDVPEIQANVFLDCLNGVEQVRRTHRSTAILIHGGAGSGKTHLLGRLRTQLTLKAPTATDRDECLFVWVRLQASPRMIWRHVRRTLVEDWFRPIRGQSTQFSRILFRRLAEIRVAEGDLEPWYEFMLESHPAALDQLLDQISESLFLDRNTTIAFKHLAFARHTRDLRAWLGGDSLPEQALARLDLSQEEGTDEEREHEARRVVLMLCRLAGDDLPIVLSLDQVEALQTSSTDREGLFAFGQLVSTLHDETSNVLIIASVQSAFATELKDQSRGADYDRMTSLGARSLATLTRGEAEKLIAVRRALSERSLPLPESRDPLWPLEQSDFHRLMAIDELTPRRLLATCAERFESWLAQSDSKTSGKNFAENSSDPTATKIRTAGMIQEFLGREWARRFDLAMGENQPDRTEEIIRHGLPQLMSLTCPQWVSTSDDQLPDVHIVFDGPTGEVGISVCVQSNMRNVGEQFKRLLTQFSLKRLTRLVVVQDHRIPLTKTAKVAQQSLDELEKHGAMISRPSEEILARLEALRNLLSDAKSGDLANEGISVSTDYVENWLKQNISTNLREFAEQMIAIS